MSALAQGTSSPAIEVLKIIVPALAALLGVGLGSGLTRGRERRIWRRDRLVDVAGSLVDALASVEQWAISPQFANRLAQGQYPTEYKDDLAKLSAAAAKVTVSFPDLALQANATADSVRTYVDASTRHQSSQKAALSRGSLLPDSDASVAAKAWTDSRTTFLRAARAELDSIK